jgi:hypothetical protein
MLGRTCCGPCLISKHRLLSAFGLFPFLRANLSVTRLTAPGPWLPAPPTCPPAALTALQALKAARLQPGQRVLIHAAAGGVGSAAVQIAKAQGLHVVATASSGNAEFVKGLGAGEVIDYKAERCVRGRGELQGRPGGLLGPVIAFPRRLCTALLIRVIPRGSQRTSVLCCASEM